MWRATFPAGLRQSESPPQQAVPHLDLKSPRGIEILKRLIVKADVVVENFRPDVKTRLGIDYETLSKLNPRLIYGSISGFGQDRALSRPAGL
jgi:formyl-CoA transferase